MRLLRGLQTFQWNDLTVFWRCPVCEGKGVFGKGASKIFVGWKQCFCCKGLGRYPFWDAVEYCFLDDKS